MDNAKLQLDRDGYCIIPRVLSVDECDEAVELMWEYLEDTTYGAISKKIRAAGTTRSVPQPCRRHDGHIRYEDAGWLMGRVRELLADRLFRHYFNTSELHVAKEGFIFHTETMVAAAQQQHEGSSDVVNNYRDGENRLLSAAIVRGLVALTDNNDVITVDRGATLHLQRGDVLLWQTLSTDNLKIEFDSSLSAYAYCTQRPASATSSQVMPTKLDAYKQRQTGDCQPDQENWISPLIRPAGLRPFYRASPPLLSYRQAELYGLVPYQCDNSTSRQSVVERALIGGVRFVDDLAPAEVDSRPSLLYDNEDGPYVDHICAAEGDEVNMAGQEKYLGGMASPCGRYVRTRWRTPCFSDSSCRWTNGLDRTIV
jgi:hypothetical protein